MISSSVTRGAFTSTSGTSVRIVSSTATVGTEGAPGGGAAPGAVASHVASRNGNTKASEGWYRGAGGPVSSTGCGGPATMRDPAATVRWPGVRQHYAAPAPGVAAGSWKCGA